MDRHDKREFFRLEDSITMEVQIVTRTDIEEFDAAHFFNLDASFLLLKEIYSLEMESTEILRNITSKDRQLGSFLSNISKRIEILSRSMTAQSLDDEQVTSDTEISESGISFIHDTVINNGELLALKMLFRPSMLGLHCFAETKNCRLVEDNNEYRIGAGFLNITPNIQRLLSRHIIRKQSEARRQRLIEDELD